VVAPDNRDTGSAGPHPEGFTVDDMAADALVALESVGHSRAIVVGHSMGGMIAQALAFSAPERVERLILVSTLAGAGLGVPLPADALELPPLELPDDPEAAAVALRAAYFEKFMAPDLPNRSRIAREEARRAEGLGADLNGLVRQLQAISAWVPPAELKELGLDITVVHGDEDTLVDHRNGQIVAERAGVPLVTLEGVGHMVPWEAPEALAELIAGRTE
jgi:pimeloyl-ACP methyl ester carboxylesterase